MLRVDQLYFRNFFILFFITLFVTALSGYFLLKKIEINNHKTMLTNMIEQFIVSQEPNIDEVVHRIKEKTGVRVTIIDADGVVRYESDRAVEGMKNHLNRPEVAEASQGKIGSSVRFSQSVGRDFLYVVKEDRGRFIRMAYALESIQEKFFKFWIKAIALFSLAMAGAFWMAMRINRKISSDLERINASLEHLLNKKYSVDFTGVRCCKEFDTISKQIAKVSKKLEKRDKQKAKYTKNLKLLSKRQGDIISAISHEFKNPVAAIMGYTQTVKEDVDLTPQMRDRFLDKVLKNSQKITTMIDRLSLAVKLENDTFAPTLTTFSLHILAQEVRETLMQKYHDRDIVLEVEDIMIKADREMFDNLLINLVENALKYSEDVVVVRTYHDRLEVIDKGIGISKEDRENITKRFFRVDSLSWDNSIGVGLYIVKYILKLHKTRLEIESKPEKGSTFWFSLSHLLENRSDKKEKTK
jgi:signal transduction histidine kinase